MPVVLVGGCGAGDDGGHGDGDSDANCGTGGHGGEEDDAADGEIAHVGVVVVRAKQRKEPKKQKGPKLATGTCVRGLVF